MKRHRILLIYLASLLGIVTWLGAIWLAPYLARQGAWLGKFIYVCFSPTCHQIASRSFHFAGYPLAVCARCLGIYCGFLGGLVFYPFIRGFSVSRMPRLPFFLAFSVPIIVDTAANFFHLWASSNVVRWLVGFLWGGLLPFYWIAGLADLAIRGKKQIE